MYLVRSEYAVVCAYLRLIAFYECQIAQNPNLQSEQQRTEARAQLFYSAEFQAALRSLQQHEF